MRVLVVEDEIGLAEAVGAILRKEKYIVDIANNGKTGLEYALTGEYDCILLDIMLPGMNGLDVLTYLRVREIETPVLLLTAKSEIDDKIKGLDCGADDYLTKPFSMGELLARIPYFLLKGAFSNSLSSMISYTCCNSVKVKYSGTKFNAISV